MAKTNGLGYFLMKRTLACSHLRVRDRAGFSHPFLQFRGLFKLMRVLRASCAAILMLGLVACTPDVADTVPSDGNGDASYVPDEIGLEIYRNDLAALAKALGIEHVSTFEVVRWVEAEESAAVIAVCMTELGYPASVDENGILTFEMTPENESGLKLANYECMAKYPIRSDYWAIPDDSVMTQLYNYYETTLVPCLVQEGFSITDMPSLEVFLATPHTSTSVYSPYSELVTSEQVPASEVEKLTELCPPLPAELSEATR